jgi:RecB family endonuclease NucS
MNNKENTKFLLYKIEEVPKKLEKEEIKQERKEKFIQKLFEENLTNIFSNLIFLGSECELEADIEGENHRLDTLAFDKKKEHFVIIEYKRGKASELASQIKAYLNCLEDIDNQYTLLRILSDKFKSKKWNRKEIEWDEAKGVCIATEIDRRAT